MSGVQAVRTPRSGRTYGVILALLAACAWANSGPLIDFLSRDYHISAVDVSFWRSLIIVGVLAPVVWRREGKRLFRLSRREWLLYSVNGVIGVALFNLVWSASVQVNGAAVATTILYCFPIFVAIGVRPLLGEQIGLGHGVAISLNILGCALVAGVYDASHMLQNPLGVVLGVSSGLTFAFFTLCNKITGRHSERDTWANLFYLFCFGTLALVPFGLVQEGTTLFSPHLDPLAWLILAALALLPSLCGYIFFSLSLTFLPAAVASLFPALEVPIAAVIAMLFLGRIMSGVQWFGAALIVGAVVLLQAGALWTYLRQRRLALE